MPNTVKSLHLAEDGLVAGRYLLQRRLGGGKDGACWLATDNLADRVVACKVAFFADEPTHKIFWKQYTRLLALRLPSLVLPLDYTIHDFEGQRHPVVAMECLEGETFDVWAARANARNRVEAVTAIAKTLLALQQSGATHGDLFEGNVIVVDDAPVLIDPEASSWGSVSTRGQEETADEACLAAFIEEYCDKSLVPSVVRLTSALKAQGPRVLEEVVSALGSSLSWSVLSQNSRLSHQAAGQSFQKNLADRTAHREQIVRARHAAMDDLERRINDLGADFGIRAELATSKNGAANDLEVVGQGHANLSSVAIHCTCEGEPNIKWHLTMDGVKGFLSWWPYGGHCIGAIDSAARGAPQPDKLYVYLEDDGQYRLTRRRSPDKSPWRPTNEPPGDDDEVPLEESWIANRIRKLVGLAPLSEE